MKRRLFQRIYVLLRTHPSFSGWLAFDTLSTIGSLMTNLAVYGTLERVQAGSTWFTLAYLSSTTPGVLAAFGARYYRAKFTIAQALLLANVLSSVALLITWLGYHEGNLALLLSSNLILSLLGGATSAHLALYFKRQFQSDEISLFTALDTTVFAIQSLFGTLLAVVLFALISVNMMILIDALTFILQGIALWYLTHRFASDFAATPAPSTQRLVFKALSAQQKQVLFMGPALALFGCAFLSLGPALVSAQHFASMQFGLAFTPVLVFTLCRTLGQLLGPVIAHYLPMQRLTQSFWMTPTTLVVFCSCYYIIAELSNLTAILVLVIAAHIVSNILSMLAFDGRLRFFDETQAPLVASLSHSFNMGVGTISALMISALVGIVSFQAAFAGLLILSVLLAGIWMIGFTRFKTVKPRA
ncbi:MFS transporter [Celerinatantimonas yamalensis]|uniref:MFS transporter n=1 Tax=Celerinatantimonas yamalensis TaxID=559956 RepID=A0ABW9GBH5_9GAMM